MLSARVLGLAPALRQTVPRNGLDLFNQLCLLRPLLSFCVPAILLNQLAVRVALPKASCRTVQTQSFPSSQQILNSQRLHRPSSPHFTIYQPQLTWLGSIANRFTGTALSFLLYGFSLSYLILPAFGMHFDGAHLVDLAHSLPEWVKYSGKILLATPFAFHGWNGVRHLFWDTGRFLSVRGAYATGYAVLGATALTTMSLLLL